MTTKNSGNSYLITPHEPRFRLASNAKNVISFGFAISRKFYNVNKTLDEEQLQNLYSFDTMLTIAWQIKYARAINNIKKQWRR
mgnify:FL=1